MPESRAFRGRRIRCGDSHREAHLSTVKTWFFATRPWSFTAAFVPVAVGTALAWGQGAFHLGLFLLAALGGIALQAGTNLINTYGDFTTGVDTPESAPSVPHLVQGLLEPRHVKRAAIGAFALAALLGVPLLVVRGWPLAALGALGIVAGWTYTAGPLPYKYQGLGSLLVFFLMGPAMVWGAFYVQTGRHDSVALLASLPVGFLVSLILHSNDLRDLEHDRAAGIATFALLLGKRRAFLHFHLLLGSAFLVLAALVVGRALPWPAMLPFLLVPRGLSFTRQARAGAGGDRTALARLEPDAGLFHLQFGLLLALGIAVSGCVLGALS